MATNPSPAFPESALMDLPTQKNAMKQIKKNKDSFILLQWSTTRKAHKFPSEIHKWKSRPSPTYRSCRGQRGGRALGGAFCSTWAEADLEGSKPAEEPNWKGHEALWELRGRKGWEQGKWQQIPFAPPRNHGGAEGNPSFRPSCSPLLKLFPNWEDEVECGGNATQTFTHVPPGQKFPWVFNLFSADATQPCPSLTLPVLFPSKRFLLPAATDHLIRMPGDHFHTMLADVIFLDAHTVHHLDTRWQGDGRVTP